MLDFKKLIRLTADNFAEAKRLISCLVNEIEEESNKKDKKEIERIRNKIKGIN